MFDQMETPAGGPQEIDFDTFYKGSYTSLIAFTMRLGAAQAEAEDAAQEAMMAALRTWPAIGNPGAYVRKAATGAFYRRRNKERDRRDRERQASRLHRDDTSVVIFEEETRYVMGLLAMLPPAQREVMAWTSDGYEPAEIAEIIGKKPATVRTNLRHARRSLLQKLNREDSDTTGRRERSGP